MNIDMGNLVVGVLIGAAIIYLFLKPKQGGNTDIATPIQNLTQSVNTNQAEVKALVEKVTNLVPIVDKVDKAQQDLSALNARISTLEQNQNTAVGSLQTINTEVSKTSKTADNLTQSLATIINELSKTKTGITELQTTATEREKTEKQTAENVRQLHAIIAGTQSKGEAGENVLEAVFANLPVEWQEKNFKIGNKTVEFALKFPNNHLVLPIDSKWPATDLIKRFVNSENLEEKERLKGEIEDTVLKKVKEVKKYIDSNLTTRFAIAAVPDAVYDLCTSMRTEAFRENVHLISYSLFLPFLLLVFQTVSKASQQIDLERLEICLHTAHDSLKTLQEEVEGRFSTAVTMLNNSQLEMRKHLSKTVSSLTSLEVSGNNSSTKVASAELQLES